MSQLKLATGVAPANPPAGQISVYAKGDKLLYSRDDTGTESGPFGAGGGGGAFGPENAVYLAAAPRGNDGTGTRGDPTKPFLTLQAALNACVSGDTLFVGPGLFHQGAVTTVWPVALLQLSIVGAGSRVTTLGGNGGASIITPDAPLMNTLYIEGVTISTKGIAGRAILADGTGQAGAYFDNGLHLRDVRLSADVTCLETYYVSRGTLIDVDVSQGGDVRLDTSNFTTIRGFRMDPAQSILLTWDDDSPDRPGTFRQEMRFHDCDLGTIGLGGQPWVYFCKGNRALSMTDPSLTVAFSGAPANVEFHGEIEEVVISAIPLTPYPQTWNFDQTHFRAPGGKAEWAQTGPTINRQVVSLRGATGPGQLHPGGALNVTAKDGIDLFSDIEGFCNLGVAGDGTHTPRRLDRTGNMINGVAVIAYGITPFVQPQHAYASVDVAGTGGMSVVPGPAVVTVTADNAPLPAGANITVHCVWDF